MDRRVASAWDEREAARVEATRARNEALRQRLLNPKVRVSGRDESALAAQIAEKRAAKEREREEGRQYAAFLGEVNERLGRAELDAQEQKQARNQETLRGWQAEAARVQEERKAALAEYHRKEPKLGASSAQTFDGEDVTAPRRTALQQLQVRKWVADQAEVRRLREEALASEERAHAEAEREMLRRCDDQAAHSLKERKRREREVQAYNQLQHKARQEREAFARAVAKERERQELATDVLDQGPTSSAQDPRRHRPDHFRGIGEDGLRAVKLEQERQIMEGKRRDLEAKEEEANYAAQQEAALQMANHVAYDQQEARKKEAEAFRDFQLAQAAAKACGEAKRDEGPAFGDDFFNKFGTSHR